MTATAEYPSMLLPAAPPFRVDVPEGFIAHAAPHALAMVRRADGERAATENVTVTSELVQAGSTARDLLGAVLAAHPDGRPWSRLPAARPRRPRPSSPEPLQDNQSGNASPSTSCPPGMPVTSPPRSPWSPPGPSTTTTPRRPFAASRTRSASPASERHHGPAPHQHHTTDHTERGTHHEHQHPGNGRRGGLQPRAPDDHRRRADRLAVAQPHDPAPRHRPGTATTPTPSGATGTASMSRPCRPSPTPCARTPPPCSARPRTRSRPPADRTRRTSPAAVSGTLARRSARTPPDRRPTRHTDMAWRTTACGD